MSDKQIELPSISKLGNGKHGSFVNSIHQPVSSCLLKLGQARTSKKGGIIVFVCGMLFTLGDRKPFKINLIAYERSNKILIPSLANIGSGIWQSNRHLQKQ